MKQINRQEEQDALWEATSELAGVGHTIESENPLPHYLKQIESQQIKDAMVDNSLVIARAARQLGVSRERLHHRIKALNLTF